MAAIYAKALKRKDYSGVIDKDKQQEAADKKADAEALVNNTSAAGMCRPWTECHSEVTDGRLVLVFVYR